MKGEIGEAAAENISMASYFFLCINGPWYTRTVSCFLICRMPGETGKCSPQGDWLRDWKVKVLVGFGGQTRRWGEALGEERRVLCGENWRGKPDPLPMVLSERGSPK